MRLTYKLEKEDYFEFNLNQMQNFPKIKRSINIQRFFMPGIFTVFVLILIRNTKYDMRTILPLYSVMVLGWIIFYPKILVKSMHKRLNKTLDSDEYKILLQERTIEIKDDGIYEVLKKEDGEEEAMLATDKVLKLEENEKFVYIFLTSESVYLIPKKFFLSEEHRMEFLKKVKKLIV